jgi:hypothetical protein
VARRCVDGVDEGHGGALPRVIAAPEDRIGEQGGITDAEPLQYRGLEIGLVMLEPKLELGGTQHTGAPKLDPLDDCSWAGRSGRCPGPASAPASPSRVDWTS